MKHIVIGDVYAKRFTVSRYACRYDNSVRLYENNQYQNRSRDDRTMIRDNIYAATRTACTNNTAVRVVRRTVPWLYCSLGLGE